MFLKSILSATVAGIILCSCGRTKTNEKVNEDGTVDQCYGSFTDKDSVFLKLSTTGEKVTGDLIYKLFEKDKNKGVLNGTLAGDTIFATYEFTSEGQTSTRDVAFLKKGNELIEGFAPTDQNGVHFINRHDIDFAGIVLQTEECHE
jgi:hypothetical protein